MTAGRRCVKHPEVPLAVDGECPVCHRALVLSITADAYRRRVQRARDGRVGDERGD